MDKTIDFAVLLLLYGFVFYKKWKSEGKTVLLVNTALYIYLSGALYVTLMPVLASLPFVGNHPYGSVNWIPFRDVMEGNGDFIRQVVLNVILTVPFGFLLPLTRKNPGFLKTVGWTFLLSLGIELLQPLLSGFRSADITDLITNTLGGMTGFALYSLMIK